MQSRLFGPILNIVVETMPRDNLLNSACLEFFDFIKREYIKTLISHLVEHYRDQIKTITYVDTFTHFLTKYDQSQGFASDIETSFVETEEETPKRPETGRGARRWDSDVKDLDPAEEEYFNTSDEEEDVAGKPTSARASVNGASPISKPLVDYPSDEETENVERDAPNGSIDTANASNETEETTSAPKRPVVAPPERLSEKRRREEDEEDDFSKLSHSKRRNSSSSAGSTASSSLLRRKKSFNNNPHGNTGSGNKTGKIAISLSPAIKSGGDGSGGGDSGS